MKRTYLFLSVLLILYGLCACTKLTPLQAPTNELNGTWIGTCEVIEQSGNYMTNLTPVSTTITFQGTDQAVLASAYITVRQMVSTEPALYSGTLNNHQVDLHIPSFALCDPTRRSYIFYLSGMVRGDSLTIMGNDTACPVQQWIFHETFRLTRQ